MAKLNYVSAEGSGKKTVDLRFNYLTDDEKRVYVECDTIMDFIDAMESNDTDIPMLDYTDVHAKFFDNELNTKDCKSIEELLLHCKAIIR